jgi:hypothetical protein
MREVFFSYLTIIFANTYSFLLSMQIHQKMSGFSFQLNLCLEVWGMLHVFIIPHLQSQSNLVFNFLFLADFNASEGSLFPDIYTFKILFSKIFIYKKDIWKV